MSSIRSHRRVFLDGKNTPRRHRRTSVQTNELLFFPSTSGFRKAMFARHFIPLSSLTADSFFLLRRPLIYCYVIYLGHSRHEGMRALRSISDTEGVALLFTHANFVLREATPSDRVYKATHNFALSRLTNVPAYPKLWHSVKVCFRERERDREKSENESRDARPRIDTFRWKEIN